MVELIITAGRSMGYKARHSQESGAYSCTASAAVGSRVFGGYVDLHEPSEGAVDVLYDVVPLRRDEQRRGELCWWGKTLASKYSTECSRGRVQLEPRFPTLVTYLSGQSQNLFAIERRTNDQGILVNRLALSR